MLYIARRKRRIVRGNRIRLEANIHKDIASFLEKVTSKLNVPLGRVVDLACLMFMGEVLSRLIDHKAEGMDDVSRIIEELYNSSEERDVIMAAIKDFISLKESIES